MGSLITSFSSTFDAIMGFIVGSPYVSAILGTILVLGIAGAVISFFRG